MRYSLIALPILVAIIASLLFAWIYAKKEKTDKGFALIYWKLSYRRKFIRTLWQFPIPILATIFIQLTLKSYHITIILGAVFILAYVIQAVYTYRKWKSETEQKE